MPAKELIILEVEISFHTFLFNLRLYHMILPSAQPWLVTQQGGLVYSRNEDQVQVDIVFATNYSCFSFGEQVN